MEKKGAEMTLNVIVVAALALLVLVILSVVLIGRVNIFGQGVTGQQQQSLSNICSRSDLAVNGEYRQCAPSTPPTKTPAGSSSWATITEPSSKWTDCDTSRSQQCYRCIDDSGITGNQCYP